MKKFLKVFGIVIIIAAGIYFIPRLILMAGISKMEAGPLCPDITDTSLTFDSSYEISEGNITVEVPTYFASTKVNDYSSVYCMAQQQNKELILVYYPFFPVADTLLPGSSKDFYNMFDQFEEATPGYPVNLFYDMPDDVFGVIRNVCLADKNDFNFWNLKESFTLYFNLWLREHAVDEDFEYAGIYEHEDIRAFVVGSKQDPGLYVVGIMPDGDEENMYAFIIQTNDIDDITKLLNTYEFNSLF